MAYINRSTWNSEDEWIEMVNWDVALETAAPEAQGSYENNSWCSIKYMEEYKQNAYTPVNNGDAKE